MLSHSPNIKFWRFGLVAGQTTNPKPQYILDLWGKCRYNATQTTFRRVLNCICKQWNTCWEAYKIEICVTNSICFQQCFKVFALTSTYSRDFISSIIQMSWQDLFQFINSVLLIQLIYPLTVKNTSVICLFTAHYNTEERD